MKDKSEYIGDSGLGTGNKARTVVYLQLYCSIREAGVSKHQRAHQGWYTSETQIKHTDLQVDLKCDHSLTQSGRTEKVGAKTSRHLSSELI